MLRVASYDVVFTEIPGETTLALNLSGCPVRCADCHSKHLWEDTGEPLTDEFLYGLLGVYGASVTCVAFMGGDREPEEVERLAWLVREWVAPAAIDTFVYAPLEPLRRLKTAWYSGREVLPKGFVATGSIKTDSAIPSKSDASAFDYVKLGPYDASLGGLDSPTTNQRLYLHGKDITERMWKGK